MKIKHLVAGCFLLALAAFAAPLSAFAEEPAPVYPTGDLLVPEVCPVEMATPEQAMSEDTMTTAELEREFYASSPAGATVTRYYGNQLTGSCRTVYDALVKGAGAPYIDSYMVSLGSTVTISSADMKSAMYAVMYDYPEYYWLHGIRYSGPALYSDPLRISTIGWSTSVKFASKAEYEAQIADFAQKAERFTAGVDEANDPPAVIALKLHDNLIAGIEYAYDENHEAETDPKYHSAYGAVYESRGVCESYAKTYLYLLNMYGIPGSVVTSNALNHMWSLICLNEDWYELDLTWDDQTQERFQHVYFNLTHDAMTAGHHNITVGPADYLSAQVPSATGTHFTYNYVKSPGENLAGNDPAGLPLQLIQILGGEQVALDKPNAVYTWKVAPCTKQGETLTRLTDTVWRAEPQTEANSFLSLQTGWPGEDHTIQYGFIPAGESGALQVKLIFDNGDYATVAGNAVARRYKIGDVNGDDLVDVVDVLAVANVTVGKPGPATTGSTPDVNEDGTVNGEDVSLLARFVSGLVSTLAA